MTPRATKLITALRTELPAGIEIRQRSLPVEDDWADEVAIDLMWVPDGMIKEVRQQAWDCAERLDLDDHVLFFVTTRSVLIEADLGLAMPNADSCPGTSRVDLRSSTGAWAWEYKYPTWEDVAQVPWGDASADLARPTEGVKHLNLAA